MLGDIHEKPGELFWEIVERVSVWKWQWISKNSDSKRNINREKVRKIIDEESGKTWKTSENSVS